MPLVQLVLLQLIIFVGLIFFLRQVLTRNISKATGHLQDLTMDYSSKQDAINKRLDEARNEAQEIVANAKREAAALKSKIENEAQAAHAAMLKDATEKTEQMVERAERACDLLKNDLDRKIEEKASMKMSGLFRDILPYAIRHQLHESIMNDSMKEEFDMAHLNIPENVNEAAVVSAFPLNDDEKRHLRQKLRQKVGIDIVLNERIDDGLIAGFIVTIGSVVIDGSFKQRIKKALAAQKTGQQRNG